MKTTFPECKDSLRIEVVSMKGLVSWVLTMVSTFTTWTPLMITLKDGGRDDDDSVLGGSVFGNDC